MRTRWSTWIVALVAACAPLNKYERQGDKLLAQGDKEGAAKEYEWALKERPIMDFHYERISEKRQRIVGDQWKPAVASSLADKSGDSLDRLEKLLKTRADVRAVAAPMDVAQPIENEVRSLSKEDALAATSPEDALVRIPRLLVLFDKAMQYAAPQVTVDAIVSAIGRSFERGLPRAMDAVARIDLLLGIRQAIRTKKLPTAFDKVISTELSKNLTAPIAPVTLAGAQTAFDRASALCVDLVAQGETQIVEQVIARAQDAALVHLMLAADKMIAAHHFIAATDYMLR